MSHVRLVPLYQRDAAGLTAYKLPLTDTLNERSEDDDRCSNSPHDKFIQACYRRQPFMPLPKNFVNRVLTVKRKIL